MILAIIIVVVYFLPSVIAWKKKKRNQNAIVFIDVFLGWTVILWFVAMIWALTEDK